MSSSCAASNSRSNSGTKKRKRQRSSTTHQSNKVTSHEQQYCCGDEGHHHDTGTNTNPGHRQTRIPSSSQTGTGTAPSSLTKSKALPVVAKTSTLFLNGITLAISTMDNNNNTNNNDTDKKHVPDHHHDSSNSSAVVVAVLWSYKAVQKLSIQLGARVTGQVHRNLTVLLCTPSAVQHPATQRVRKAIRHGIPLVHVQWLFDCQEQNKCLAFHDYVLDSSSKCKANNNSRKVVNSEKTMAMTTPLSTRTLIDDCIGAGDSTSDDDDKLDETEEEDVSGAGWTPAEDLGCCCVCHENGTADQCPWCSECSVATGQRC